jgi:hypothetical protein
MSGERWRVIASIRTFDLRMGKQFAALFSGQPPDAHFVDKAFQNVRHVHIPLWDDTELGQLLSLAPAIDQAVKAGGARLLELARTPFNTRLLADLVTDGMRPDAFSEVSTQFQLLELYWSHRVDRYGLAASACLTANNESCSHLRNRHLPISSSPTPQLRRDARPQDLQ